MVKGGYLKPDKGVQRMVIRRQKVRDKELGREV